MEVAKPLVANMQSASFSAGHACATPVINYADRMRLTVASFNCKNIRTSAIAVNSLLEFCDVICIQEHWLFQAQINLLDELNDSIEFAGKGADYRNPLPPIQMPRGYGGVAVLWKKKLSSFITVLSDGSERIQCVELGNEDSNIRKTIIISVYFPCRGYSTSNDEFYACVDELFEIFVKYVPTHNILVGCDLNEDLKKSSTDRRLLYINDFIKEFRIHFACVAPTFMHPNGTCMSEIDYFFKAGDSSFIDTCKEVIELESDVSDHTPIVTKVSVSLTLRKSSKPKVDRQQLAPRTNWDKIDKSQYLDCVNEYLENFIPCENVEDAAAQLYSIMTAASEKVCGPCKGGKKAKPKLAVWNENISESLKASRDAHKRWVHSGRKCDPTDPNFVNRTNCKKEFRRQCRIAVAVEIEAERNEIMKARIGNNELFYKLINKQRGSLKNCVNDLYVEGACYSGEDSVLDGFKLHFENLAKTSENEAFDRSYHEQVETELKILIDNVQDVKIDPVSSVEFERAIKSINEGKSSDVYGLTVEHILYGGESLHAELLQVVNAIFELGAVPKILKVGLVSPIFKNKGHPSEAVNYRGITVLPTLCKVVETILRDRIQDKVLLSQNISQRGFTKGSSPLNAAYILEEFYRDCADSKLDAHVILLDAKAAFDVVCHSHLLRRLYHSGVNDRHWLLIKSLHEETPSVVKLKNQISDGFQISQGVRQGGILSTDLYKMYVNPLLNQLENTGIGGKIGPLTTNNCACADDVCLMGNASYETQILINIASNFANEERYLLQPSKTVSLMLKNSRKQSENSSFELDGKQLNDVKAAQHLGITRTVSIAENADVNVNNNLAKARRTLYSLFGAGLHGENGLDPVSAIELYRAYVLPVLLYGLEILIPPQKLSDKLEIFHKKTLKQILSLPDNAADPAIYILSGLLPIRAILDLKVLSFFNNLCNQSDKSLEKQILMRQIAIKTDKSCSCAMQVPPILARYGLDNINTYVENPVKKSSWKTSVNKVVESSWKEVIESRAELYSSLRYMDCTFQSGKVHPVLKVSCKSVFETSRMPSRLKLLTGTYILQTNRAKFNQNAVDPTCQSCGTAEETVEHFVMNCPMLRDERDPIVEVIMNCLCEHGLEIYAASQSDLVNIILDYTSVLPFHTQRSEVGETIEFNSRRLIYKIHKARETIYRRSLSG